MGRRKEQKIDLDEGTSSYTHRPLLIKGYGLLSVALLAVLFIGILEIIAHKFPQASTPYRPPTVPTAISVPTPSNVVNATNAQVVQKRHDQVRLGLVVPPSSCGFSDDELSEACLATECLNQPGTTVGDCATQCIQLGIWPWQARRLCRRQASCGFTNTLNDNCRNVCYAARQGNPFVATDPICADYCASKSVQPFEPKSCVSSTPPAPVVSQSAVSTPAPSANASPPPPLDLNNISFGATPEFGPTPEFSPTPNGPPSVAPSSVMVVVSSAQALSSAAAPTLILAPSSVVPPLSSIPAIISFRAVSPSPERPSPSAVPIVSSVQAVSSIALASSPPAISSVPAISSILVIRSPSPILSSVLQSPSARVPSSLVLSASAAIPISTVNVTPRQSVVSSAVNDASSIASSAALSIQSILFASSAPAVRPSSAQLNSASAVAPSVSVSAAPSALFNLFASAASVVQLSNVQSILVSAASAQLTPVSVPSAAPQTNALASQPVSAIMPISVAPTASQASGLPVLPVAVVSASAANVFQDLKTPAQPADLPANPANPPITVVIVPTSVGGASTVIINTPSVVLPILGVQTVASSVVVTNAAGQTVTQPVVGLTPIPDALVPAANALITKASSLLVTNEQGKVSTVPVDVISPAKLTPAPVIAAPDRPTPAASPKDREFPKANPGNPGSGGAGGGEGSGGSGSLGEVGQGNLERSGFTMSVSKTFSGGYLPILLARAAHLAWSAVHGKLSAYEPFVQMNQASGASGTVLLGPTFSTMWPSFVAYGAVIVLSPLAPELLVFDTSYCSEPNVNDPINPCLPAKVRTNVPIIRTLQALLALIALMAILAAYKAFKKPTGVSADPTCIVAVASVLHHPQVVRDFQALSGEATDQDLKRFLETKKYKLGTYVTESGSERYGIIPVQTGDTTPALDLGWTPNGDSNGEQATDNTSKASVLRMWKSISAYLDGIFLLFIVAVMCIAASYVRWVDRSILARMFQFSNVGRRIVFTCIGMIVSSNWGRLLSDTQTVSPYLTLSRSDAPAKRSILIPKHTTALTSVLPSFFRGQHTTFLVASTALLAEFLVVALSGLPIRPGSTKDEFFFCGISALIILGVMIIVLAVVNVWRRALPHLPRKPDSTGSVMTYLAESRMLKDFEGIERMGTRKRDQWIETLGNRYEYVTRVSAATGQERWVVDAANKDNEEVDSHMSRNQVVHASMVPSLDSRYGPGHATPLAPVPSSRSTLVSQFDHS